MVYSPTNKALLSDKFAKDRDVRNQGRKVSIPLIGVGQSEINLNKQKILGFMFFSIALKDELTLINGIDVIVN